MADPESKVDMDPNFEKRLRQLEQDAAAEYAVRSVGGQVPWTRPGDWDGDLGDVEGLSAPFSRDQANDQYVAAVSDVGSMGTTGDIVAATTMADYLGTLERAFRVRFMRRPRAFAHMLARKKVQGQDSGPFIQGALEYARNILYQAKSPA